MANLEALQAVISDAKQQGVDRFVCTGDVVGYNANPSECLAQLDQLNCLFVKGNHDEYCSSRIPLSTFNPPFEIPFDGHDDNYHSRKNEPSNKPLL